MTTLAKFTAPTAETLFGLSGLAAIAAGLIFAGIQPVHPADVVESVTTGTWTTIISLKLSMCLLTLAGITGIYLRQFAKAGWLGVAGFAMLIVSWFLQTGFVFTELLVLPPLAAITPDYVDSALTIARGGAPTVDIGAFSSVYSVVGLCYLLGGIVFGIATFRAAVLPRWAALLWVVTALITPAAALLPHAIQRYAAVPMGITLVWLGAALWTEARKAIAGRAERTTAQKLQAIAAD